MIVASSALGLRDYSESINDLNTSALWTTAPIALARSDSQRSEVTTRTRCGSPSARSRRMISSSAASRLGRGACAISITVDRIGGEGGRSNTTITSSPSAAAPRSSPPPPARSDRRGEASPHRGLATSRRGGSRSRSSHRRSTASGIVPGRTPLVLALCLAPLVGQATLHRSLGGARRAACARDLERRRQTAREALQRELAVARLAAGILRDRDHARSQPRGDPALLRVGQGSRRSYVERRLDSARGLVGVLPSGPRRA